MTLVASFEIKGRPFVIGDLMVSTKVEGESHKPSKPFNIPTCVDVNRVVPDYLFHVVSGLKQKVILLGKNIAVAWAGDEIAAITVIRDIEEEVRKQDLTIDQFFTFLEKINYLQGLYLYLTGFIINKVENNTIVAHFEWDSNAGFNAIMDKKKIISPLIGRIYAEGNGRDDFANLVNKQMLFPEEVCGSATPAQKAILFSLLLISQLAGQQIRQRIGLSSFYGGGFELITLLDDELKKLDNITYHHLELTRLGNKKFSIKFKEILKCSYYRDLLLIRKVAIFQHKTLKNTYKKNDELYVLFPVHRTATELEKDEIKRNVVRPPLTSRFSVFYVFEPQGNIVENLVYFSVKNTPAAKYIENENRILIELSEDIVKQLLSIAYPKVNSTNRQ